MSGNLSGFDANKVEPNDYTIPAGTYEVAIVGSKMESTKNGDGKFLKLELQVLNGQFQNRKLTDRLNLINPNDVAVQIAKGTLSAICRAVGVLTPNDSSELHSKPMLCTVTVKQDAEYGPRNEIKGYKPRHAGGAGNVAGVVSEPAPW